MEDKKNGANEEPEVTPSVGITPDPEVPVTATEKDEDQLVHETIELETETVIIKETDLDDVVHEQPPAPPEMDGERDIDDLLHPRV
ncbi:MAG: hypothetical protein EOO03_02695 [Chitinophagaceae bacterium]|nr:MAG: hypothetical protein EOO03_02695 [Chitinophagaceae bacterium]